MGLPRRLTLPPPYTPRAIAGDVMDAALALAGSEGAGTLLWCHAPGQLSFAVVLEPETPLSEASGAFLAGMVAVAEALAAHSPPEHGISFRWPDEVRFDTSRLGGARLAVAPGAGEADVPDWMVFAVDLIADRDHLPEPGRYPHSTSLAEAGIADPALVVESFAAHLMLQFDRWKYDGFENVVARYRARLEGDADVTTLLASLNPARWRDANGPIL